MTKTIVFYAAFVVVFLAYKVIELSHPNLPFFHSYLEDVLAIPIVLKSAELIIRLIPSKRSFRVRRIDILVTTLMFSAYFEMWLPDVDSRFTQDWFDLIAYASGALLFWFFLTEPNTNHSSASI
ncbi:MAG: hypothetical protein R2813_13190 [Flavobacteriales bacterium]